MFGENTLDEIRLQILKENQAREAGLSPYRDLHEAKSEKEVAQKMKEKGYEYIILVPGKDALYAKSVKMASELARTDLKDYKVGIQKIDDFLAGKKLKGYKEGEEPEGDEQDEACGKPHGKKSKKKEQDEPEDDDDDDDDENGNGDKKKPKKGEVPPQFQKKGKKEGEDPEGDELGEAQYPDSVKKGQKVPGVFKSGMDGLDMAILMDMMGVGSKLKSSKWADEIEIQKVKDDNTWKVIASTDNKGKSGRPPRCLHAWGILSKDKLNRDFKATMKEDEEPEGDELSEQPAGKIKSVHPGISKVPEGGWDEWGVSKLVSHFKKLGKSIGKPEAMKAILNIERWNKNQNPKLSDKARSVIDALKKDKEWSGEDIDLDSLAAEMDDAASQELDVLAEASETGHYYLHGKDVYGDSAFLRAVGYNIEKILPGFEMKHMGFGEFYLDGGKSGRVDFARTSPSAKLGIGGDRTELPEQVGRLHRVYDNKGGKLVKEILKKAKNIKQVKLAVKDDVELATDWTLDEFVLIGSGPDWKTLEKHAAKLDKYMKGFMDLVKKHVGGNKMSVALNQLQNAVGEFRVNFKEDEVEPDGDELAELAADPDWHAISMWAKDIVKDAKGMESKASSKDIKYVANYVRDMKKIVSKLASLIGMKESEDLDDEDLDEAIKYAWAKVKGMDQNQFIKWFKSVGAPNFVSFALSGASFDMGDDKAMQYAEKSAENTMKFIKPWFIQAVMDYMKWRKAQLGMEGKENPAPTLLDDAEDVLAQLKGVMAKIEK